MIDWTKPLETTEDPPRPVRVLAIDIQDAYKDHPVAAYFPMVDNRGGYVAWYRLDGTSGGSGIRLRNVAPKPVRHEAWVNLYVDGVVGAHRYKEMADKHATNGYGEIDPDRVECRRIVWHSDGSPADDTVSREEYDRVCAEQDTLKSECEQEKRNVSNLVSEIARQRAAHSEQIKRMQEQIDATKYYTRQSVIKSCDNCANGPMYSEKCKSRPCDAIDDVTIYSWANWEPKR